ncbi:MAG: HD domain-containing protein [Acidobacteriota bacterium]|nr:HD domain-containing protein [Acidobacteriota bacterium]
MEQPQRVFAVDWSGAREGAERRIWVAEAADGQLLRIENGRTRDAVAALLVAEAERDPRLVVGIDFAFSFPFWFLRAKSCGSADEFWRLAAREGSRWSEELEPPFFRKGSWNDEWNRAFFEHSPYRKTELELSPRPETVFKLVGPRQVGKASLAGCRTLLTLRNAGFSIWPFDPPGLPLAVEIYPRLFYGSKVRKGDPVARRGFLEGELPALEAGQVETLAGSDDAFDAAVAALSLDRTRERFAEMEREVDPVFQVEGRIWSPETQLPLTLRSGAALSRRLPEAFALTVELHGRQTRKGSGTPYVSHLLAVSALVLEHGGDEDEAIAGLLHDAAEDQGGATTLATIDRRFGHRVAEIVRGCSDALETPKPPWQGRKEGFIERLSSASASVLLVVMADKVHNLSNLLDDLDRDGSRVWRRFRATPEQTLWYYSRVSAVLDARPETSGHPLLERLQAGVAALGERLQP